MLCVLEYRYDKWMSRIDNVDVAYRYKWMSSIDINGCQV